MLGDPVKWKKPVNLHTGITKGFQERRPKLKLVKNLAQPLLSRLYGSIVPYERKRTRLFVRRGQ